MNKLTLSLVLVAMFVAMASANILKKGHKQHHHHHQHDDEYEPEHEHHFKLGHHKHNKHYNHDDDEYGHGHHHHQHQHHIGHHDDECEHYGCGHHEHGHHEHEHEHKHGHGLEHGLHHNKKHGHKGIFKHGLLSKARAASAAGVGAIGAAGIRNRKELDAGVHSSKHLGSHKLAEGNKGFIAGKNKKFQAGKSRHDLHDAEGHNRQSGFNKDKLIVKEHEDGFKGDVGFHNHDEHSDSAHIGGSEGKFIAGKKGGKIVSNKDIESEHDAGFHAGTETEGRIVGAKGAGVADFE